MRLDRLCLLICVIGFFTLNVTAQTVYVGARSGKDTNDCSLKKPCTTVNRALKKLSGRGTVNIIENGTYSSFTLEPSSGIYGNSITVEAAAGIVANITEGVTTLIQIGADGAGSQDEVVLRNLHLIILPGGSIGVSCAGIHALYIESCDISGFTAGISFNAGGRLFVRDTVLRENAMAIAVTPRRGQAMVSINNSRMESNGRVGLDVRGSAQVVVRETVITGFGESGVNCSPEGPNETANLFLENSLIAGGNYNCVGNCGVGIEVGAGAGRATVALSSSTIAQNRTGVRIEQNGHGEVHSFQNNRISGNTIDIVGTFKDPYPLK